MGIIEITTQRQLDKLPKAFDEYTKILLRDFKGIIPFARGNSSVEAWGNSSVVAWENSSVVAWGNSSVEAWGNSSVVARENSSVVARGNSSVEARGNSSVEARGNSSVVAWVNSSVEAWGNSSVEARENSSVVAWENSSVEARENSSVEAWGNSSVVAWENSSVVARENSSVEAWGNSSVEAWGNSSVVAWVNSSVEAWENSSVRGFSSSLKIKAGHQSVIILQDCNPAIIDCKNTATIINTKKHIHDLSSFSDIYPPNNRVFTLYKSVNTGNVDFYTGKIQYIEGREVECPDFDPNPQRQCGGGLHLSPTPQLALGYNKGQLLECLVKEEDIVIFGEDITKVRCRKVFVVKAL
jgi:hypothetical protein